MKVTFEVESFDQIIHLMATAGNDFTEEAKARAAKTTSEILARQNQPKVVKQYMPSNATEEHSFPETRTVTVPKEEPAQEEPKAEEPKEEPKAEKVDVAEVRSLLAKVNKKTGSNTATIWINEIASKEKLTEVTDQEHLRALKKKAEEELNG